MKTYNYEFHFDYVPGVMKRQRHGLIVLTDDQGKYILSGKKIYPPGIYRFIGGGLDDGETSLEGIIREVKEEVDLSLQPDRIMKIAFIKAIIHQETKTSIKTYNFKTHLFCAQVDSHNLTPKDDIQSLISYDEDQLRQLIKRYSRLSNKLTRINRGGARFRWSDYGRFYGLVHQIGLNLTAANPCPQAEVK